MAARSAVRCVASTDLLGSGRATDPTNANPEKNTHGQMIATDTGKITENEASD